MFSATMLRSGRHEIEFREDNLTGLRCRISSSRGERGLNNFEMAQTPIDNSDCPFCPENINSETPCFENGERIHSGESTTFPNSYPFGENHIITVMTREHNPRTITKEQIRDSLLGQFLALREKRGFKSINWNYLPSSGASMIHPHLQGISDKVPTFLTSLYIGRSRDYAKRTGNNYWQDLREAEKDSPRYLFGDSILWHANPVPLGEKEIRGIMPICSFDYFGEYIEETAVGIKTVIEIYQRAGNHAFNMSIRFGNPGQEKYFRAFVSIIARIDPNPYCISDSAFMERLHFEPVIMTRPEGIKDISRDILK